MVFSRTQMVKVTEAPSNTIILNIGLQQGSVLGPIFFY